MIPLMYVFAGIALAIFIYTYKNPPKEEKEA